MALVFIIPAEVLSERDRLPYTPDLPALDFTCSAANYPDTSIMDDIFFSKPTQEQSHNSILSKRRLQSQLCLCVIETSSLSIPPLSIMFKSFMDKHLF